MLCIVEMMATAAATEPATNHHHHQWTQSAATYPNIIDMTSFVLATRFSSAVDFCCLSGCLFAYMHHFTYHKWKRKTKKKIAKELVSQFGLDSIVWN